MNQMPQPNNEPILEDLKKQEEIHRSALNQAMNGDKPATPTVIEDLQTRYFLAKQARENFESKS